MADSIELTQQHVAQTYGRPDFVLSHGEGIRVWGENGKEYLDMVSGIAVMALGHSHPQITDIIKAQAEKLIHVSNLYYTAPQAELAQLLCEKSFADRVFFCNSGAEANEACIKFARKVAYKNGQPERTEIISFSGAFHGRTMGVLAITPKEKFQAPFRPLMPGNTVLPFNDIAALEKAISDKTAAVFIEPIQGEGGVNPANGDFLKQARELCNQHGVLLVFDEVQCGLGRTGKLWAYEHYDVQPDLMALAKPLANGLPIGACLMTENVHSAVEAGDHGSTFAAGLLVCAVAKYVLETISQPAFLAQVNEVSEYLWERLAEINSPHIKEIRGKGLMIGLELDFPAKDIVAAGYEHGLLMVNAGENVLRLLPPLILQKSDLDIVIERLSAMLAKHS